MTKIAVIIGTTRTGRVTDRLAKWVANEIEGKADVEIVDLADYPMPFADEQSPRFNPERKAVPEVQKWLDKMAEFDGYVFVTPEYNRTISGVLKNAFDQIDYQMNEKPSATVSHGSVGGAFATSTLRDIIPQLGSVLVPSNVFFGGRVDELIDTEGELAEEHKANPWGPQVMLEGTVKQLVWIADALKSAK